MEQDVREITDTIMRYARGVDRRDWDLVRSCFHPDAQDDHGPYKGGVDGLLEDMVKRHERIDTSLHHITNVLVEVDEDVALSEAYCIAYQRFRAEDGEEQELHAQCRYVDRFERRDGTWRIARRVVVFETQTVGPPVHTVPTDPSFVLGKRSTEDPVYSVTDR